MIVGIIQTRKIVKTREKIKTERVDQTDFNVQTENAFPFNSFVIVKTTVETQKFYQT